MRAGYDKFATADDNSVKNNRLQVGAVNYIDDNATVIIRYDNGDKYATTTGKDLKGWSDTKDFDSAVLANTDSGTYYAKVIYVNLGTDSSVPGGADTLYAYLYSGPEYVDADDPYREYTAWNGSEDVTVKVLDEDEGSALAEGTVIEYTLDADGYASIDSKWEPADMIKGAVIGGELADDLTGSANIATNGQSVNSKVYDIDADNDPIVLFVNMDDESGAIMTSLRTAIQATDNTNWINNAVFALEDADNIKVLVIDAGDNDLSVSGVYDSAKTSTPAEDQAATEAANKTITDAQSALGTAVTGASGSGSGADSDPYKVTVTNTDAATLDLLTFAATGAEVTASVTDAGTTTVSGVNYADGKLVASADSAVADGTLKFTVTIDNAAASVDPVVVYFEITLN